MRIPAVLLRQRCADAMALALLREQRLMKWRGGEAWASDETRKLVELLGPQLGEWDSNSPRVCRLPANTRWELENPQDMGPLLKEARGAWLQTRALGDLLPPACRDIEDFVRLAERLEADGCEPMVSVRS